MTAIGLMFTATAIVSSGLSAIMPRLLAHFDVSQTAAIAASALIGPAQVAGRLAEMGWLSRYHPLISARLATMFLPIGTADLRLGRSGAGDAVHDALRARQRHPDDRARHAAARRSSAPPDTDSASACWPRRRAFRHRRSRRWRSGCCSTRSPAAGLAAMAACNMIGLAALFVHRGACAR